MLQITHDYKLKVLGALLEVRKNFDGSNKAFAEQWGLNHTVFSQLCNGKIEGLVKSLRYPITHASRRLKSSGSVLLEIISHRIHERK